MRPAKQTKAEEGPSERRKRKKHMTSKSERCSNAKLSYIREASGGGGGGRPRGLGMGMKPGEKMLLCKQCELSRQRSDGI